MFVGWVGGLVMMCCVGLGWLFGWLGLDGLIGWLDWFPNKI